MQTDPDQPAGDREGWLGFVAPLLLGLSLTIVAAALVVVELAQPSPQRGFRGILFSNAVNSKGAQAGVALFRRQLAWLPYPASGLILSPSSYVDGLRVTIVAMAFVQIVAAVIAARSRGGPLRWLIGPAAVSVVFLFYPPICTDVFSYASFGWEANRGANPYLTAPAKLHHDPFARMNDWTHISTPYGPVWTDVSRFIVAAASNHPFAACLGFKAAAALSALGLGWLAYQWALRITGRPGLAAAALTLVSWSPIVLIESAGQAHNDAMMMLLAVGGLLAVFSERRGATRAGLMAIMAAALIKPVALPFLGLAALSRIGRTQGSLVRAWLLDAAAAGALTALAFAPYWADGRLPGTLWDLQKRLYLDRALQANPLWRWEIPHVLNRSLGKAAEVYARAHATTWARGVALVLLAAALVVAATSLRRRARGEPLSKQLGRQALAWAIVAAALGLAPINAQAWYAIWAIVPIGTLWAADSRGRLRVWLAPALVLVMTGFLIFHTMPIPIHPAVTRTVR